MNDTPCKVCFLLIPGFALMSYASAVEPLRAANRLAGRTLYRWSHATLDGRPAQSSNGVTIAPDVAVGADQGIDWLFVVAAAESAGLDSGRAMAWLRHLALRGVRLGGVSGGPFLLARAGVLAGYRCTVHWDHHAAFVERFPDLDVTRSLFEIDRGRFTCAGGIAGLDLMHALIAEAHGRALASEVSDWFLSTQVRAGSRPQRLEIAARYGIGDAKLIAVLGRMEEAIEEPVRREELAAVAGVSVRQLERLFRSKLGCTIKEQYLRLRLDRARALLTETSLSVSEVAIACGFVSASHFADAFRRRYGTSPTQARRTGVPELARP
ncbi:GlxA family transcriptional regulator [Microbaculum marinum]|uniref:GlxA family transcriptional regulator n=1 Tax=Microbaculum marinum TaxID=1764581 RepID=UPI00360E17E6